MNDLISRQAAIEAIEKEIERIRENPCVFSEGDFYYQNALKLAQEIIELQPPVTPTERTGITTDIALSLYEEIRCEALCTNPMKSDRGCDGGCQYDKELLKRIDEVIEKVLVDSPTERTGEWTNTGVLTVHCSNCKSEFHELEAMNYCPNCGAKMGGDTE